MRGEAGGWRLEAGGWRLTERRQETEKVDELPPALFALVAPVAFRAGLRWISHHTGSGRDCVWVSGRRRYGTRQ